MGSGLILFAIIWIICGILNFGLARNAYCHQLGRWKVREYKWQQHLLWLTNSNLREDAFKMIAERYYRRNTRITIQDEAWLFSLIGCIGTLILLARDYSGQENRVPLGLSYRVPANLEEEGFQLQITDNRSE